MTWPWPDHDEKDNPCDFWHLRQWLQFRQLSTRIHDNLCYLTIKSDTGQQLQFLRCFSDSILKKKKNNHYWMSCFLQRGVQLRCWYQNSLKVKKAEGLLQDWSHPLILETQKANLATNLSPKKKTKLKSDSKVEGVVEGNNEKKPTKGSEADWGTFCRLFCSVYSANLEMWVSINDKTNSVVKRKGRSMFDFFSGQSWYFIPTFSTLYILFAH